MISKSELDVLLLTGDSKQRAIVHSAIDDLSETLVRVRSFEEYNACLAIDIGGSNVRCGIVKSKLGSDAMVANAKARSADVWRHGDKKG